MCKLFGILLSSAAISGSSLVVATPKLAQQSNRAVSHQAIRDRFKRIIAASGKADRPVSKQLMACRATNDFIKFAKQRGASVTKNAGGGSHTRVTYNGIYYILASTGVKNDLQNSACKLTIEAFKAMGIAWDDD